MANLFRVHPLVGDDLAAATGWYAGISMELGNRFRQSVNESLDRVELMPLSFGRVESELRVSRVDSFPYLLVFESDGKSTDLLGVFHSASDPQKWRGRKK